MVNPLSNPAGNIAPRWVYQAILVEMTDKILYGLCATRHNEIRGIFNGGIWPIFTPTHYWHYWFMMISGGDKACFQADLLNFDAFLIIFHFCQGFPEELYLISSIAGETWAGCRLKVLPYTSSGQWTSKNLIFPLKFGLLVSLYLCNKHDRFHLDIS